MRRQMAFKFRLPLELLPDSGDFQYLLRVFSTEVSEAYLSTGVCFSPDVGAG